MDKVIVEHRIHTFGWYLVVTKLYVRCLVLIIHRLESAEVFHNLLTIWLLLSGVFIIVSF